MTPEEEKAFFARDFADIQQIEGKLKMRTLNEYERFVGGLFKPMNNDAEYMMHAAIGIAGEGGEILDACKKTWIYNKPLDEQNVIEELGDVLFYIQAAAIKLHVTIETLMEHNMHKLRKRYPEGYTDKAAQDRADKK